MLTEIIKELLDQVTLTTRQETAITLSTLSEPPEPLINIMCEDVVEVSGPLLEKAILPDEKLIHIIRYGTEAHRIHISRRFGLSPLVRHELENAHRDSESSRLKYSLTELDKLAEEETPALNEETTANILEVLRAQKIHDRYPDPQDAQEEPAEALHTDKATTNQPDNNHMHAPDVSFKETAPGFPTEKAANDAIVPSSNIQMGDASLDMDEDVWQQVSEARDETNRQREFARTIADWFWEVDRTGHVSFISEDALHIFGRTAPSLIGEDFVALCRVASVDGDDRKDIQTLESLFEHRASFRNMPFYITGPNDEIKCWYLSAIAIFDIHSGRFTGFRGSARSEIIEPHTAPEKDMHREEALEEYTTTQALKAVSQKLPRPETLAVPQNAVAAQSVVQKAYSEEMAAELLQNVSHEFRTPLNAIIGFSEMIDMEAWGPVNKQYHDNIKNILTAAVHLKEAVNDVLDSAKLDAGLMQIAPESFSLKAVLKSCLENVDTMAHEKEIQLMDNDNNIDVILYNDKQSVELCLTKMLTSIIRRANGHETIGPSVLINSNAQVRIELPVPGPRIKEENAAEIFRKLEMNPGHEKNYLENGQKTEPQIAAGFGLSIARNLAHLIGGDISAHCTRGYVSHLVLTLSNYDPAA
ncbi:hypothetical protein MNBD_ALPHA02-435 [hydrothermal vent metagenome]|uniref:Histidine kinase domain-containing protein n=1 Tax=hydrothermal vent metagenome TaxID=652676 RepID=A0A3B0R0Q6_9ZZZZ